MKRIFFLIQVLTSVQCFAQSNSNAVLVIKKTSPFVTLMQRQTINDHPGYIGNVNINAVRYLMKNYDSAENIEWFENGDIVTVYFTQAGQRIKIRYDKNGFPVSIWKTYSGYELDRVIKEQLNEEIDNGFYPYLVTELIRGDNTIYEISVQSQTYWQFVRVTKNKTGILEKSSAGNLFIKE